MERSSLTFAGSHAKAFAQITCVRLLLQIDLVKGMMDCLYAECKPCITDCVMAELEKLGQKYRVALKVAKVSRRQLVLRHIAAETPVAAGVGIDGPV